MPRVSFDIPDYAFRVRSQFNHTLIALDFTESIKLLNGLTICNVPFENFDFCNTFADIVQLERGQLQSSRRLMKRTRAYTELAGEIEVRRGSEGI